MDLSNKSNEVLVDVLTDIISELRTAQNLDRRDALKKAARAIQKELQRRQLLPESFDDLQDPKDASSIKNAKDFIVKKYAIQRMLNDPSLMDDPETANAVWKRWSNLLRKAYEQGITDHQGNILESVVERKLSKKEIKTRDKYADDLPDKEFKKRYGKDWESVKYATATKMAKKKNEDVNESLEPGTEVVLVGRYELMKPYGNNTSTTPDPLLRYEVVGYNGIVRTSKGKRLNTYIIQDEEGGQWEVADYSIEQTTGKYQPYTGKEHGVASSVAPDKHYGDIGTRDPKVQAAIDQASSYDDSYDDQRYFQPSKATNPWGVKGRPADGPEPDEYDAKRAEARKKIERHQRERAERERIKALKQKRRNEDVEQELMDQWLAEKADPCWKGYEMIGMKKKGNKDVPNCVPKKGKKNS